MKKNKEKRGRVGGTSRVKKTGTENKANMNRNISQSMGSLSMFLSCATAGSLPDLDKMDSITAQPNYT